MGVKGSKTKLTPKLSPQKISRFNNKVTKMQSKVNLLVNSPKNKKKGYKVLKPIIKRGVAKDNRGSYISARPNIVRTKKK